MPLYIVRQDITKMAVDAIVNTTNEEMVGYSGVDYAVHEAAGPRLDRECRRIAPLGLGMVKVTPGYDLAVRYIIHTSGPIWRNGLCGEQILLRSCYEESLKAAVAYKCESVAFPLISSGAYRYPKDQVLKFAVQVISEFLLSHDLTVYLCVFDPASYEFSKELFSELQRAIEGSVDKAYCVQHPVVASASFCGKALLAATPQEDACVASDESFLEYMKALDKPFAYKLFEWIDKREMTDVECYKKANVDKKTFSKIKCNPDTYKPSKQTAVAFAIALRLNLEETQTLLASAGLTLSDSFTFDKIIRYFIQNEMYDIHELNEALFEFDQMLLGC